MKERYWNNTDQPEDVTDEEWDKRCSDWDKALGGDGCSAPVESGTQIVFDEPEYSIMSQLGILDSSEDLKLILEKVNKRYIGRVRDRCIEEYINNNKEELLKESERKDLVWATTSMYLKASDAFEEFKKTQEYETMCEEEQRGMYKITKHLLRYKISDFIKENR